MFYLFLLIGISFIPISVQATSLRIISLSPQTTEIAYEAGLGGNLVAVSAHSDYPAEAKKLEQVANYQGINIERVISLKPDLVLAWKGGNPEKELAKLADFGIKIFYSNPHSLYEAANAIEELGTWSKNPEKAKERADALRLSLNNIKNKNINKSRIRYFYQLSKTPLMTNNEKHWPQPLFTLCGGENIFAKSPAAYPIVGIERIIQRDPQAIFYPKHKKGAIDPIGHFEKWANVIPAIKRKAIFSISGDWLSRPTPRALQATEEICKAFDEIREQEKDLLPFKENDKKNQKPTPENAPFAKTQKKRLSNIVTV